MMDCSIRDLLLKVIDNRGKTPPVSDNGHKLLEVNSVSVSKKYPLYNQVKKSVSEETYHTWFRSGHPQIGDIIVPTVGTLGAVSYVNRNDCCIAQNIVALRPDPQICDSNFLYYLLSWKETRNRLLNLDIGAVQPSIKVPHILDLKVKAPSLQEQKRIARILSSLDDKIELNNQINRNLEDQAKAIFKSWFVDFDKNDGKNPADWKETFLSEIADFVGGYSYKGSELQPSDCVMATIKNFDRNGGFKTEGFKEITPSNNLKDCQKIEKFDVLVAHTDLTQKAEVIGNAEFVLSDSGYNNMIMSMDLVKVVPKNGVSRFLLGAILRTPQFKSHALEYVNGTTVLHMSKSALSKYHFLFPTDFSSISTPSEMIENLYRKIACNIEETRKLATLRDTLLPKLMSGAINSFEVNVL